MQFYITLDHSRTTEIAVTAEFYTQNELGVYEFYNINQIEFSKLSARGHAPSPVFSIGGENVLFVSQQPFTKKHQLQAKKAPSATVTKIRAVK